MLPESQHALFRGNERQILMSGFGRLPLSLTTLQRLAGEFTPQGRQGSFMLFALARNIILNCSELGVSLVELRLCLGVLFAQRLDLAGGGRRS